MASTAEALTPSATQVIDDGTVNESYGNAFKDEDKDGIVNGGQSLGESLFARVPDGTLFSPVCNYVHGEKFCLVRAYFVHLQCWFGIKRFRSSRVLQTETYQATHLPSRTSLSPMGDNCAMEIKSSFLADITYSPLIF